MKTVLVHVVPPSHIKHHITVQTVPLFLECGNTLYANSLLKYIVYDKDIINSLYTS